MRTTSAIDATPIVKAAAAQNPLGIPASSKLVTPPGGTSPDSSPNRMRRSEFISSPPEPPGHDQLSQEEEARAQGEPAPDVALPVVRALLLPRLAEGERQAHPGERAPELPFGGGGEIALLQGPV